MTASPPPSTSGSDTDGNHQPNWRDSALVALVALVAQTALAWWIAVPGSFRKYALAAELWLEGELPTERLVDFSPLYFQLSLWLERWVAQPEKVMVALQIVLGAASVGLLHALLARRVSRSWALLVGFFFAIDRHLLVYERILEPEVILLFLLLLVLVLLDRRPAQAAGPAGIAAALALAARPTFLPAFALVPFYFAWRGLRGKTWWRASLAFAAPVALAVGLLGARATAIGGDPGTPVMNPGTVFFEGNNPLSHGTSAIYPPMVLGVMRHTQNVPDSAHQHYRDVARGSTGERLGIAEVNAYWSSRAMAFLRDHPTQALARWREKLIRAVHSYRWHDVPTAWRYDAALPIPSLPFGLLAPLALVGAALEARRWRASLLIYALAALQLAVMLVFYVSARQRLVLLPAVLYFVAVALEALFRSWRRERRRVIGWGMLCALLALVLVLPDDAMRDETYRRRGFAAAEVRLDEIRALSEKAPLAHHAEEVVEAVATAPWWLDWLYPAFFPRQGSTLEERVAEALEARLQDPALPAFEQDLLTFDLAAVLLRAHRLTEAETLLEELVRRGVSVYRGGQQPSYPGILLARLHLARHEPERAEGALRQVLEDSPGDPFALAELLALTGDPRTKAELERYWSALDANYLLGRALLRQGRPAEAVAPLAFVVDRFDSLREARVALAAALGRVGRLDEGAAHYLAASRVRPEPIVEPEAIIDLFRRWQRQHPDDAAIRLTTAQVLHQHGLFSEALALLRDLQTPPELAEPVAREIERLEKVVGFAGPPQASTNSRTRSVSGGVVSKLTVTKTRILASNPQTPS